MLPFPCQINILLIFIQLIFAIADIFGVNFGRRCDSERNYHDGEGLA